MKGCFPQGRNLATHEIAPWITPKRGLKIGRVSRRLDRGKHNAREITSSSAYVAFAEQGGVGIRPVGAKEVSHACGAGTAGNRKRLHGEHRKEEGKWAR